jgi:hypothetical protein
MTAQDDYSLYTGPQQAPPPHETPIWVWAAVGAGVVLIAAIAYWFFRPAPQAPEMPAPVEAAAPTTEDVVPPPSAAVALPPLTESDSFVAGLVRGLSSRPELARWLATKDLVRNFAVVVDNVAEGVSPAKHLPEFAPKQTFRASGSGGALVIDPRSFARYDGLADAVASLDTAGAVKAYRTMRPLFDDAYRELGHPDGNFDVALQRAISNLLATPDLPADARLESRVQSYHYADPSLEGLQPAEKLLLRMGPRNERIIKDKLREILHELGFEERR